jgi:hypothetical protein
VLGRPWTRLAVEPRYRRLFFQRRTERTNTGTAMMNVRSAVQNLNHSVSAGNQCQKAQLAVSIMVCHIDYLLQPGTM